MCSEDVCSRAVLPCRNDDRDIFLASCKYPAVLRVDLVVLLENAAAEEFVDNFPREESLTCCLHLIPDVNEVLLKAAECLLFRNAGVSHAIVVIVKKFLFLCRCEVSIMRNPVIVVVCHEVHDVLFEVVGRAGNNLNLVLTNHLCE